MKAEKPTAMNVRLPPDVYAGIKQLARQEDRSLHWIIIRLLREALAARGVSEPGQAPT